MARTPLKTVSDGKLCGMDDDKADELISALQQLSAKFDDSSFFSSSDSIYDILEDIRDKLASIDSTLDSIKDSLASD